MKRTISLMLAICLCAVSLFGCTEKQAERTKREILPEVAQALEMDDKDAAEVEKLFEAFDEAFARLGKNPTDEDFYEYATVIHDKSDAFYTNYLDKETKALSKKLADIEKGNEKDIYFDIALNSVSLQSSNALLRTKIFDVKFTDSAAEECAEAAFAMVNEYSNFFYGEDWITEEKLDSLG